MTTITTETPTTEQVTETVSAPKDISSPDLSFADYERLRRGEELPASEQTKSAPTGETQKEHKKSPKSDAGETEEEEGEPEEAPGEEGKTPAEPEEEPGQDEKPKKKGGFQRRIDKKTRENAELRERVAYLEQLALKSAGDSKGNAPGADQGNKSTTAAPEAKPKPDDFDTHAEYVEAIADFKAEQKLKERDQKAEKERLQSEQSKLVTTYAERAKSFAEKAADFEDVLSEVDDVPLSVAVREIILQADNGPELAYELAKNREEYERVCKLPPIAAAREIGKLEARIAAKASAENKPEPKKITQAPKPIDPVGSGKATGAKKTLEEMSFAEYEKARREQMKRRGA